MRHPGNRFLSALSASVLIHLLLLDLLGRDPAQASPGELPHLKAVLHRDTGGRLGGFPERSWDLKDKFFPQETREEKKEATGRSGLFESIERSGNSAAGPDLEVQSAPLIPEFRPMTGEELQAMARISLGRRLREARLPVNETTLVIHREGTAFKVEAAGREVYMLVEYTESLIGSDPGILPPRLSFPLELEFQSQAHSGPP